MSVEGAWADTELHILLLLVKAQGRLKSASEFLSQNKDGSIELLVSTGK